MIKFKFSDANVLNECRRIEMKRKTLLKQNSKFMRMPNAQSLFDSLQESVNDVDKNELLVLAMDGPTINWNVLDILDNNLAGENFAKTENCSFW